MPATPTMSLVVQKYGGTSVGTTRAHPQCGAAHRRHAGGRATASWRWSPRCRASRIISSGWRARSRRCRPSARWMCCSPPASRPPSPSRPWPSMRLGKKAVSLTGAQAGIVTDGFHTKAKIANITPRQIRQYLKDDFIVIVAGFQGETSDGRITTLGRGGSDLTAIAIASAINAQCLPDFHRRRRRLYLRPAHRDERAQNPGDFLRRDARNGQQRLEGDAVALGRVRKKIRRRL